MPHGHFQIYATNGFGLKLAVEGDRNIIAFYSYKFFYNELVVMVEPIRLFKLLGCLHLAKMVTVKVGYSNSLYYR